MHIGKRSDCSTPRTFASSPRGSLCAFLVGFSFFVSYFSSSSYFFSSFSRNALCGCATAPRVLLMMHESSYRFFDFDSRSFAAAKETDPRDVELYILARQKFLSFWIHYIFVRFSVLCLSLPCFLSLPFCIFVDKRILVSIVCVSLLNMNSSILITREFPRVSLSSFSLLPWTTNFETFVPRRSYLSGRRSFLFTM